MGSLLRLFPETVSEAGRESTFRLARQARLVPAGGASTAHDEPCRELDMHGLDALALDQRVRRLTAIRPISASGWRTVVSAATIPPG